MSESYEISATAAGRILGDEIDHLRARVKELEGALLEWWDDPDNPPMLAGRLARERDERGDR